MFHMKRAMMKTKMTMTMTMTMMTMMILASLQMIDL
jgi:hypothetical protein